MFSAVPTLEEICAYKEKNYKEKALDALVSRAFLNIASIHGFYIKIVLYNKINLLSVIEEKAYPSNPIE